MAGLSASGLGSGLDINSLVSQLMTVEQQPLVALNKKEASYQAKISALGSLKSALSALQTASESLIPALGTTAANKYTTTTVSLSDSTLVTATATNSVAAGSHTLSDITVAKAHQIRKGNFTTPIPAGTLTITVGTGSAISVAVGSGDTLSSIKDAINASSTEVEASVINDGGSDYLVLTGSNTGAANSITVAGSTGLEEFDFSTGTTNAWNSVAPKNASVTIDGLPVTSPTNSISTAISGLTLNLVKDGVGPTTMTVSKNNAAVTSSLNAFIKAYNDTVGLMKSLGNYDAANKQASTLTGDATLRSSQSQLRSALFASNGGSNPDLQHLSDLGVTAQLDGTLKLDSTKLTAAIASDFSSVATLVSDIGSRFKTTVSGLVSTGGAVSARIDGINSTIKDIGKRRDALNLLLTKVESNYRSQFTALDVQVAKMQSLSTSLAQQLASLPSISR